MKHMEKVSFIYAAFVFMSVTNGCLATLYADTKSVIIGNSTIVEKPLIISTWFPFDKNEHYWVRPFSLTGAIKKHCFNHRWLMVFKYSTVTWLP